MNLTDQSNLFDLLTERLRETPEAPAYRQFDGKQWTDMSWGDVGRAVARWQAGFKKEGLKAGDRVALCLHNRVEWVLFDQAALGLGLVTVPLYFDDRPDNMAWCLNDAGVRLLLLEDGKMWNGLRNQVKTVERVVCLDASDGTDKKVVGLAAWLPPAGADMPARSTAKPADMCTIVYTSGTTGRPKGVMLSHRNILSNVLASMSALPAYTTDRFLSFLPLSHMFERTCGYYSAIWAGAQTVYARSITLLADDIREQKPTILISVPRIFERIYSKMQEAMAPGSPKRKLFEKATEVGWRRFRGEATFHRQAVVAGAEDAGGEETARPSRRTPAHDRGRRRRLCLASGARVHRPRPAHHPGLRAHRNLAGAGAPTARMTTTPPPWGARSRVSSCAATTRANCWRADPASCSVTGTIPRPPPP